MPISPHHNRAWTRIFCALTPALLSETDFPNPGIYKTDVY